MEKPDLIHFQTGNASQPQSYSYSRFIYSKMICMLAVMAIMIIWGKSKVLPYLLTSVGPGADPGVQAFSAQMTISHPPGDRLPLLSARPAVTFSAEERYCLFDGSKLYCLVTEAHRCKQPSKGCYWTARQLGLKLATTESLVQCLSH